MSDDGPMTTGTADRRVAFQGLIDDLAAESVSLRRLLAGVGGATWLTATPAAGWDIRDQVSHLAYFDGAARLALLDPDRFTAESESLGADPDEATERVAAQGRHRSGDAVRESFELARYDLIAAYRGADPRQRLPWYGVSMSAMSAATARLMETWAHGVDVADALGAPLEDTARLGHVAHLGVRTMPFSFSVHGREVPAAPVRVELGGPAGARWAWGPEDADDRVQGRTLDFCLVVTQRRHVNETGLRVSGAVARDWMGIAQAFAGPPTVRPEPPGR